ASFQRRDVDSQRIANKTVYRYGDYQLELAAYVMHHDLWHPSPSALLSKIRLRTAAI
ncbi:MAG: hypothetical protein RL564_1073, partial [Pseudomonadota bacterium]